MPVTVRPATEADLHALTKLDLTHTFGERYLALQRFGDAPELDFSLRWREGTAREETYATVTVESLRDALHKNADAFLVAEVDGAVAGYVMIVVPRWTDAAEITDLAVDRPARRGGAGRALVDTAAAWARAACAGCGSSHAATTPDRSSFTFASASASAASTTAGTRTRTARTGGRRCSCIWTLVRR